MLSPGVTVGPRKGARFLWSLDGKGLHRLEDALLTAGELAVSPSSAVERALPCPEVGRSHFLVPPLGLCSLLWSHPFRHWDLTCPGVRHGFQIKPGLT